MLSDGERDAEPAPRPMPAQRNLGHEVGLLRGIVQNLAKRPVRTGPIRDDLGRAEGFARGRLVPDEVVGISLAGILLPGIEPYTKLSEKLFDGSAKYGRGTTFEAFQYEFFGALLSEYLERDPSSIRDADVLAIEAHLADWFVARTRTHTLFVPCVISPWQSARFSVGPVSFIFIEDVPNSKFYLPANGSREVTFDIFGHLLEGMRAQRANWLAVVEVMGCDKHRAQEIGDLAVDIAIVALQLATPHKGTKRMSRLDTRRGPGYQPKLLLSDGEYSGTWSTEEPGIELLDGTLRKVIRETAPLIEAAGNRVRSFTTGSFRLPNLEQAWCDAAYWLHQGLAETIDSIAVVKLETAIEVLLHAESVSGSESRILTALETFFGQKAHEPIGPSTQITAKEFARGFVRDRSRVLHGTWPTLNVRLGGSREGLENLAASLARASAVEIDAYMQSSSATDDTEAFLSWVKSSKQTRAGL